MEKFKNMKIVPKCEGKMVQILLAIVLGQMFDN
jgi:hypothetical protein